MSVSNRHLAGTRRSFLLAGTGFAAANISPAQSEAGALTWHRHRNDAGARAGNDVIHSLGAPGNPDVGLDRFNHPARLNTRKTRFRPGRRRL